MAQDSPCRLVAGAPQSSLLSSAAPASPARGEGSAQDAGAQVSVQTRFVPAGEGVLVLGVAQRSSQPVLVIKPPDP